MLVQSPTLHRPIRVVNLGLSEYVSVWRRMQHYTRTRGATDPDQIWLTEHHAVFTCGRRGKQPPRHAPHIPLVYSDRGGQVTYHAPGQLVAYLLLALKPRQLGPKSLVQCLEQAVINLLAEFGLVAARRDGAPGVYVKQCKIAALGLRIRNACCYHGLSLNVCMDLTPYDSITPCGLDGLRITQLCDHGVTAEMATVQTLMVRHLCQQLGSGFEFIL